jgi:hypothetical protein
MILMFILIWFGLWCLMPLSTIFQLYRGDQQNIIPWNNSMLNYMFYLQYVKKTCIIFSFLCLLHVYLKCSHAINISVISWRSVLLVEETRVPGENHWPVASHWQTLSHNVVSSTPHLSRVRTHDISGDKHRK